MADLFEVLRGQVESNARHAVDVYRREVPEYRTAPAERGNAVLDFAMFIRRCSIERAAAGLPLTDDDLASIVATGRQRGEQNLSMPSQQQVLALHTSLMLREIQAAATPRHTEDLLRFVGWFGPQGVRARAAYLQGYLSGVGRARSLPALVRLLARLLCTDEPVEVGLADQLGVRLADRYLIVVGWFPLAPVVPEEVREEVVERLLARGRLPMDWCDPSEFVALVPVDDSGGRSPSDQALGLVRAVAAGAERPCAVGTATGPVGGLAEPLTLARRVSRTAPPELTPGALWSVSDLFVEVCVARDPRMDEWLRGYTERLRAGADLVRTLDAYYRNDMNRVVAAEALRIHPRTLDYRLRRVRELTGLHPASTQGVRILTAAVTRALAIGWS